jgi:excisionase family DNA binding protein
MSTAAPTRWHSPPQIAEQLGVDPSKVLGWIKSGILEAINVSNGRRQRYRISPEALEQFLSLRSTRPAPKPIRRQRPTNVKEFF